ncbi:MAG: Cof-type HAD-IIB family hydrolase [Phycisphaerae bacterium]|nr:MAG: Cof-type HAD-IIB family hydrolase [Phycisphaerae bacterium]
MSRYGLLALDLDGTLLDSRGRVSPRNKAAVRAARDAGMRVVVCTGRGLAECRHVLEQIDQSDPVVVAGGSIIADPQTARTLHRFPVHVPLVERTVRVLLGRGHPALVLKDPHDAGYDYLVVQGEAAHPLDPVTEWWFASMNVRVRFARRLEEDAHPEHTVRVGACGLSGVLGEIRRDLLEAAEGEAVVHSFPAVVAPEHASRCPDGQSLHILELFHARATKWAAISHLAAGWGLEPTDIAAIGDEVNDVSMIAGAGLGVAMGNAVPVVRDAAKVHTAGNDDDGVAVAVERILTGAW